MDKAIMRVMVEAFEADARKIREEKRQVVNEIEALGKRRDELYAAEHAANQAARALTHFL